MKLIRWTEVALLSVSLAAGLSSFANAEETKSEKTVEQTKETGRDLKKNAKKTWRHTKDEACEMVNGKLECDGKKMKHKMQNGVDEMKDKVDAD
jgi:F0F1-type ATP synthase membrane subunit b/b'